jgi:hypothetical protein
VPLLTWYAPTLAGYKVIANLRPSSLLNSGMKPIAQHTCGMTAAIVNLKFSLVLIFKFLITNNLQHI